MCDTQVFFVYSWCSIHVFIFPSDHIPHGPQTPHPTWRQTHCSVTHSCTCQPLQEPPSPPALGFLFNTQALAHTGQGIRSRNQTPVVVTQPPFQRRYSPGWSWRSCVMFPMWVPHAPNPSAQQALSSPLDPGKDKNICFHFCCLGNVTGGSYGER